MADADSTLDVDTQDIYAPEQGASLGTALNVVGGLASLALIAGIGVWGYNLVMRDVSGVPVVRALQGPMRVQPEDPGGREADHQGLAVNAVAAQGLAEAPADRLTLAPRPVELTADDQPRLAAKPVADGSGATRSQTPQHSPVAARDEESKTVDGIKSGSVQSMVDQLIAEVMPDHAQGEAKVIQASARIVQPAPLGSGKVPNARDGDAAVVAPAVVTGPGPARSLRPKTRPARALQPASAPRVARTTPEVDADSLPSGTRLAQLGAYESAEVARQEWVRLSGRFGDYLQDKSRVIQKASSGGRTFYRLRALGFEDLSDARRFCSVLVAEKADCIPVTTR
ncbi:SPOR domain-containing protein [Rhodobacteraceae bacterium F11138]|nr:SPOR domain-containing protein [Rhodobacteraceae bacterium F11138]